MSQVVNERTVAESLKVVMVKKNTNIRQLSKKMGISSTSLYSKFSRGNFSVKDIDAISKALGIKYSISFIVDDNET